MNIGNQILNIRKEKQFNTREVWQIIFMLPRQTDLQIRENEKVIPEFTNADRYKQSVLEISLDTL